MASSDKKRAANRANAQRSTGPRTAAGKRRSSQNAVVHGLTARSALLHGDDEDEFNRLARRTFNELDPVGPVEEQLVAEIINHTWKLRRVPAAETLLFDEHHRRAPRKRLPDEVDEVEEFRKFLDLSLTPKPVEMVDLTPAQSLGHMVQFKTWASKRPDSPVLSLERYAGRIERARGAALRMLLALQKRREAREEEDAEQVEDVSEADEVSKSDAAGTRTAADAAVVNPTPPAVSLEGPPSVLPAPPFPPLAVSQTGERSRPALRLGKPQAGVEKSSDNRTDVRTAKQNSNRQNEPTDASTDGKPEVTAPNRDALNDSSAFAPPASRSEPTARPFPAPPGPVEPGPPIGESPPATT